MSEAIAIDNLRQYIEKIERLEEEKANLGNDVKDIYAEAKGNGFDVKVMRKIVQLRKLDDHVRSEQEELLEIYKNAIGL